MKRSLLERMLETKEEARVTAILQPGVDYVQRNCLLLPAGIFL